MGVNRVIVNGTVKLDLTVDTVDADSLKEGVTAHGANGESITGTLSFRTLYTDTSEPTSADGNVGDIWIITG